MKRTVVFLANLLILLLLNSCVNKSQKRDTKINRDTKKIIRIIPKSRDGRLSYSYIMTRKFSKLANLNMLENGFDSLFIRVWYQYSDTIKVLDFKNEHGHWIGELHIMNIDGNTDSIGVLNTKVERKSPKSGWNVFIDHIFSLGIITLPDFSELPLYEVPTDGFYLDVEVATTTQYRIYTYGVPYETNEIKQVSNILKIMKLIESEFGVPSLDRYYFQ